MHFHFLFIDHHPSETGKTPTEAHSGLKHLISALVEEIQEDASFKVSFQIHILKYSGQLTTTVCMMHLFELPKQMSVCQCPSSDATASLFLNKSVTLEFIGFYTVTYQ